MRRTTWVHGVFTRVTDSSALRVYIFSISIFIYGMEVRVEHQAAGWLEVLFLLLVPLRFDILRIKCGRPTSHVLHIYYICKAHPIGLRPAIEIAFILWQLHASMFDNSTNYFAYNVRMKNIGIYSIFDEQQSDNDGDNDKRWDQRRMWFMFSTVNKFYTSCIN